MAEVAVAVLHGAVYHTVRLVTLAAKRAVELAVIRTAAHCIVLQLPAVQALSCCETLRWTSCTKVG